MSKVPSSTKLLSRLSCRNSTADRRRKLPVGAGLGEVLEEKRDRQAALDLELAVESAPRPLEHLAGDVGRDDLDRPAEKARRRLAQDHGQRIGLLAGRGGGAPDAQPARRRLRREAARQEHVAEEVEGHAVAKEEGLVRRHRLDDGARERRVRQWPQPRDEVGQRRKTMLLAHRREAALDEVALLGRERETRAALEEAAQEVELGVRHRPTPSRCLIDAAMRSRGRISSAKPPRATWPGMPQTVLVASSWAMTAAPVAASAFAPASPSEPMPVSTTASAEAPKTAAASRNRMSTAGRQKLTAGPSSTRSTTLWSLSRTSPRWRPPGAT